MFQYTIHHLSSEQIAFLNRGPTYVSPCQIHILSKSSLTLSQIVTKQMAPLRRDLTKLFTKYPVDLSRRINFEKQVQQLFNNCFIPSVPSILEKRVIHEKKLISSIRNHLTKNQLILRRTADDMNTFYLGSLKEFNKKSIDYMTTSHRFDIMSTIDKHRPMEYHINVIVQSFNSKLEELLNKRLINKDHHTQFKITDKRTITLPYLYFLPEINYNGEMSVQPRFSSYKHSPIYKLAQYLDQLIRPLYENFSRSTTFLNGSDFIQKFETYATQPPNLRGRAQFATYQIHNLYSHISHSALIETLGSFLVNPLIHGRHEKLSNEAIQELVRLVLKNNYFIFKENIYLFGKGCALNLTLTELLGDIYLHDWQLSLVRSMRLSDTFYGRFHTQGFVLWNHPVEHLFCLFDDCEQLLDSDLRMTFQINERIQFLNVYIENNKGFLQTRVYRDPHCQPFLLPFAYEHPRLIHRQWFRYALKRAGQYCQSFADFDTERIYIESTMLANGYSLDFVEYHIRQFLQRFSPNRNPNWILNQHTYILFRRQLFRSIKQEKQQREEEMKLRTDHKLFQLHYLYDWGLRCEFNEKFHRLWSSIINQDSIFRKHGLKIKLKSKHCYLSNTILASSMEKLNN